MIRKKGQIKPFSFPRSRAIPFSIELTPVASPPNHLYIPRRPAVNVFQGGTLPPLGSPPLRPPPISALFPHLPLPFPSLLPPKPTELRISGLPQRENISRSLSYLPCSASSSLFIPPLVFQPDLLSLPLHPSSSLSFPPLPLHTHSLSLCFRN